MTVRWGFLGAGWIARRALAPAVVAAAGASLQAVASRDLDRSRSLGPAGSAYASYDELLGDPDVDAVYISLSNEAHAPWTIAALRAGKHVLCEKPLAMNVAEVDRMAEVARTSDRMVVEASWYRWHPRIRLARRLIDDGAIGAVRHVSAGFSFAGELAGNYRLEPQRGGGALYDVGCYAISAALWAFGNEPVCDVMAQQTLGPTGVDLATEAVLSFDAGEAKISVGIDQPPAQWLVIRGDSGQIELRDAPYTSWSRDETTLLLSDGEQTRRIVAPPTNAYQVMVEDVSAVIRGRPGWVLPVVESRATAAVIDACFASARAGGQPVSVTATVR
jgi:xylose dehydrogenase (NAD/NADP)